jgi:hypothetical protein
MKIILFIVLLLPTIVFAQFTSEGEEKIYTSYRNALSSHLKSLVPFTPQTYEEKIFVDALEDDLDVQQGQDSARKLHLFDTSIMGLEERVRIEVLKLKYQDTSSLSKELLNELKNKLREPVVEKRLIYILAAHENIFLKAGHFELIDLAKSLNEYSDISRKGETEEDIKADVVTDLYFNSPDLSNPLDGKYNGGVKLYMFCRQNRLFPCLMIMRDSRNKEVRLDDDTLWSHAVLASSKHGFPSYQRNGNTPAGVFTIDSVMPIADQRISYGKFRRMMLNFVPTSQDEILLKSLLPKSSWGQTWWTQTTVARDIGRNLFRIHGTGTINEDANSSHYPFVRTSGCIANRENTYDGKTYQDQRVLLDAMMIALDLDPKFKNETKIKGLLFMIELDNKNKTVELEDLKPFGIN